MPFHQLVKLLWGFSDVCWVLPNKRQLRKNSPSQPRLYILLKTAAELEIVCSTCGTPSRWFDYELGEKNFYAGIACDKHKISTRIEKLAQQMITVAVQYEPVSKTPRGNTPPRGQYSVNQKATLSDDRACGCSLCAEDGECA